MIETKTINSSEHIHHAGIAMGSQKRCPAAIIFLGPPGAGKGTQAQYVANELSLPHISTGEVFRTHVASKTALGLQAEDAMRRGLLVSDNVVCGMVAQHIQKLGHAGSLIFDGFPRSVPQAEWLDHFLHARVSTDNGRRHVAPLAIQIKVTRDQLLRRLSGRRSCPSCGRSYNLNFQPPKNPAICDYDGAQLTSRQDDCESVVMERLLVHEQNTLPLTEYYRYKNQLQEIDGNHTVSAVRSSIASVTRMLAL